MIDNFKDKKTKLELLEWEKIKPNSETDLIINTTSLGMNKNEKIKIDMENLKKNTLYSDIIYKQKTETMKNFEEKGFLTQNGLSI